MTTLVKTTASNVLNNLLQKNFSYFSTEGYNLTNAPYFSEKNWLNPLWGFSRHYFWCRFLFTATGRKSNRNQ
jgi:hypothetical protein